MFGYHTPESSIARSDSKNPATTCNGITSAGRPCRRALGTPAGLFTLAAQKNGALTLLDTENVAAFFCWQHKEQAKLLKSDLQPRTIILPLKGQSSIDELAARVGILNIQEDIITTGRRDPRSRKGHSKARAYTHGHRPPSWQETQGSVVDISQGLPRAQSIKQADASQQYHKKQRNERIYGDVRPSNVRASWSCCIVAGEDDSPPVQRRRQDTLLRPVDSQRSKATFEVGRQSLSANLQVPVRKRPAHNTMPQMQRSLRSDELEKRDHQMYNSPVTPTRPQLKPRHASTSPPNSQTMTFLSYIPPHLSPSTTSALLAELSRPISEADEAGYIYIFWLTAESDPSKPDDETASHLLDDDDSCTTELPNTSKSLRFNGTSRVSSPQADRAAHMLRRYASVRKHPKGRDKILLKIGRATNVHRRLSQWTKQCGQNLTLIRYYPHVSSQGMERLSQNGPHGSYGVTDKRTVPHVHRVERLVHIELAEKRVTDKDECRTCGRIHKEWFEIEATRQGLQDVDEVIRRWVDWSHDHIHKVIHEVM